MLKPRTVARCLLHLASLSHRTTCALLTRAHAALKADASAQYEAGYACHLAAELGEQVHTAANWPL